MLRLPIFKKSLRIRNLKSVFHTNRFQSSLPLSSDIASEYKKGDVIHGFCVEDVTSIDEMFIKSIKLTHQKTNAQYLHLQRDDNNNVFSINFRTTPTNSTGIPHILEHLVLCGSEKFPCKDVFTKMLTRSIATFMNALTGPDYTFYPFSTQNQKDFKNVQTVYLDLVLKPSLNKLDFWTEGWRLEHTDPNDKTSPIIFKGVVFNEMKGVFNENQYIFLYGVMNNILPSHTYSVISGGNPLDIPNLTHEQLLEFHKKYYHPSNGRFFSYGNLALEDHLKMINEEYLSPMNKIDITNTKVPPEPRWSAPRRVHLNCRPNPLVADPEKQSYIAISQICNNIEDTETSFDLSILSQLLLKGPNSAFYKSLIDTNMGSGFASVTGYDTHTKDTMFIIGLQEVRVENFEKIEKIYDETLANVVKDGFKKKQIEAILHNIELNNKHQTSNFGLHLLFNIVPLWNHDGNVVQALKINESIAKFRKKLETNPRHLEELVEKYLINNKHRLIATMSPDKNFESNLAAKEKQLLESKLSKLSKQELEQIYQNGQQLLAEQKKKDNEDSLPTLKLEDLKEDVERYSFDQFNVTGVPVQISEQPTNEVCYYHSVLNTRDLSAELKPYIPLFNDVLMEMGTKNYDYRKFDEMIHLKTGGLSISNHISELKDNLHAYEEGILLHSYCLNNNKQDMWNLWLELLNNFTLKDVQRFEILVKMYVANLLNGIAHSGHLYAMSSAASIVSPICKMKESVGGLEYINRMKSVAQLKDFSPLLESMNKIAEFVLNKSRMRSAVNTSEASEQIVKTMEKFHSSLRGSPEKSRIITHFEPTESVQKAIHHVLPYNVNYTSKAILTVPLTDPDYAALLVLAKLITTKYLNQEIREKGGAYGGGAKMTVDGVFNFYSYRDPNSTRSFDIFDGTYEFLSKYDLTEQNLMEAKLSVFQQLDAPVSPNSRGISYFLNGITYDDVQLTRRRVIEADQSQLMRVAEKYLKINETSKIGRAFIGPADVDLTKRYSENWEVLEQEDEKMTAKN